jgi:biotin transport system substrate-specific component
MTIAIPRLDRSTAADRGITLADFLVPVGIAERMNARVRHMVLIAAGTLFIILTTQVHVALEPVPITGQTFGVLVAGCALGFRRGATSVALYVLLGAIGLGVFAEHKSGVDIILGSSGGYIVGFIVAGALVGRLAELGWDRHIGGSFGAMLLGEIVIFAIGLPWLKAVGGFSWADTVAYGLTPFLAWDALKLTAAALLFPTAWWLIGRRPEDR